MTLIQMFILYESYTVPGPNSGIKKWPFSTKIAGLVEFRYLQIFIGISGISSCNPKLA